MSDSAPTPPESVPRQLVDALDGHDEYYGSEINHGRLYPNLDALVEKGLVEKGQKDDRTNAYMLTQRGQRELEARREWENQYADELVEDATAS